MDTNLIFNGNICPYCGSDTQYVDSSIIYGKSYGMIYLCKPCDAYVGVHDKRPKESLGRLANKELRELKKKAHFYFDQLHKTNIIHKIYKEKIMGKKRYKAYMWLSDQMDLPLNYTHIGMFDNEQCQKVIDMCKPIVESFNTNIGHKHSETTALNDE